MEAPDPQRWLTDHGDAMYRYAMLRLKDASKAEDAVQESLLAALSARDRFAGDATERTWLVGILRHKVADTIRKDVRARAMLDARTALPVAVRHQHFDPRLWAGFDPESEEAKAMVREEVAALGSPMREALCLRIIDGLSTEVCCEVLGLTPTNLWTLVHRAKQRLRERMSERLESGKPGAAGTEST